MRNLGILLAMVTMAAARPALAGGEARLMAETCLLCHSAQMAESASHPDIPALAGRKAEELRTILLGFRDGSRSATLMGRITRGYTPDELAAIAGELSRMGKGAKP